MKAIGRYAILGLLGRGGMGAVFKAAMPRTGRVVALKLLRPSDELAAVAGFDALRRGFYREAALMARIRHPGVAQVLDVDEDASGCPFFVMEYYCNNLGAQLGESYRVEEPTRRLGVEQSLSVARQLASALARLHHEGILHRDVKPYNLMLADSPVDTALSGPRPGDEVKLIDFGLSRLRGELEPGRPRGAVVGSPYYAAPEQEADPASADERADVFSTGVTLFRCLTGRLPQEGAPASALRDGLDARFDVFFARCCHGSPEQRPSSARALLAELAELAAHWNRVRSAACALPPEAPSLPDNLPDNPFDNPSGVLSDNPSGVSPGDLSRSSFGNPSGGLPDTSSGERVGVAPAVSAMSVPSFPAKLLRTKLLRAEPLRQPLAGARERFGLDELWRPRASFPGRFSACGDGTVRDTATNLVWEQGGSPYAVSHAGALAHAERLNAEGFGGRGAGTRGWRLPTVDELCTLLLPEPDLRQLCVAGVFDPSRRRLWSADRKSFMAAWYADAEHGFVWWQDATCEFFARCVASEG